MIDNDAQEPFPASSDAADAARVIEAVQRNPVDAAAVRDAAGMLGALLQRDARAPAALVAALTRASRVTLRAVATEAVAEIARWSGAETHVASERARMQGVRDALIRIEVTRAEAGPIPSVLVTLERALAAFDETAHRGSDAVARSSDEHAARAAPARGESLGAPRGVGISEILGYIARGNHLCQVEEQAARDGEFAAALVGHIETLLRFRQPVALAARRFLRAHGSHATLPAYVL